MRKINKNLRQDLRHETAKTTQMRLIDGGIGLFWVGYYDSARVVHAIVDKQIDASFYIRSFYATKQSKNHAQLEKSLTKTISDFQRPQNALDGLILLTLSAKDVKSEYTKGIKHLQQNLADTKKTKSTKPKCT